ncbi:hypothetical protein [Rhizobium leguminosarum]|nr:hypothetical protein [Rhizobium leguminosarum]MBY5579529.1 hypothetical protein [Rhizobium leguminosarum]
MSERAADMRYNRPFFNPIAIFVVLQLSSAHSGEDLEAPSFFWSIWRG